MLTLCMHGVLFLTVFYFESVSAADDLCLFGGVRFSPFTDSVIVDTARIKSLLSLFAFYFSPLLVLVPLYLLLYLRCGYFCMCLCSILICVLAL